MKVVILSGGNSSRMNSPKAFLSIKGSTLIETICNAYLNAGIKKPIIVFNCHLFQYKLEELIQSIFNKVKIIKNSFPEKGRTFSIQLGLMELDTNSDCFIQNIDNPEVNKELIKQMLSVIEDDGFVVPVKNGRRGHPILLGKNIVNHLKNKKLDNWILRDELKSFKKIEIEAGETNVLLNLNTPLDWENYLESHFSIIK